MASSAASETILFIGAVLAASALAGVFAMVVGDLSDDVRSQGDRLGSELRTDITIINDPNAVPTAPLVVYVKNTGTATLLTPETTVLLDGVVSQSVTYDVLGSTDDATWPVGAVLQITVSDLSPGAGDHRLRVVSANGIDDSLEFTV